MRCESEKMVNYEYSAAFDLTKTGEALIKITRINLLF